MLITRRGGGGHPSVVYHSTSRPLVCQGPPCTDILPVGVDGGYSPRTGVLFGAADNYRPLQTPGTVNQDRAGSGCTKSSSSEMESLPTPKKKHTIA